MLKVKVDGISSLQEMNSLLSSGVDIVSTMEASLVENAIVSGEQNAVAYCCDLANVSEETALQYAELGLKNIEFSGHTLPTDQCINDLRPFGSKVFFSAIRADHDTDPSWILSRYSDVDYDNVAFQVDLLHDIEQGWRYLNEECPKCHDLLQVSDIVKLASRVSLFISVEMKAANVADVLGKLTGVSGIVLRAPLDDEGFGLLRAILDWKTESARSDC